jgi:hypothetical protein
MKIIITENKLEKAAISWLNKNYGDLEPFETGKIPDYIFYLKGKKIIFDYNKENKIVFVNYNEIWSFLKMFFNMNTKQIQQLTKIWVEEHYNLKVFATDIGNNHWESRWRHITN